MGLPGLIRIYVKGRQRRVRVERWESVKTIILAG